MLNMTWPKLPARAPEAPDPPGVTVPAWLVRSTKLASWLATLALVYFLWLYTLDIAKDRSAPLHLTHVGPWITEIQFWFPYIVGFAMVAFGIPYVAKIAIPTFVSLTWRENPWPKAWALFIALAVSAVVMAGTFAVQGETIMESGRESAVATAQIEQSAAVLQAQIAAKEAELRSMMENRNAYLAQAASVGAAEWERSYIAQTPRNDPQRDRIVRALGAARAADAVRAELTALRTQAATSTTVAAVADRVETPRNAWIGQTLDWLEGARAMLLSFVMDIVALLMPWISLRLEQARARQLAAAGFASDLPEDHMIPDLRSEPSVTPQPMDAARAVVRDAETGEELVQVKPHWRKLKRGKKHEVQTAPENYGDEPGAFDPARTGTSGAQSADNDDRQHSEHVQPQDGDQRIDAAEVHAVQPTPVAANEEDLSDADLDALLDPPADAAADVPEGGVTALPDGEGVMVAEQHDAHVRAREQALEAA